MKFAITALIMQLLGLIFASPVAAVTVSKSFTSTITEVNVDTPGNLDLLHPLLGTVGSGTFTYNTDDIGLGAATLMSGQFQITFNIFGQAFEHTDDIDFPNAPELNFVSGIPVSIDFSVGELPSFGPNLVGINEPKVLLFGMGPKDGSGLLTETVPGSGVFITSGGRVLVSPIPGAVWIFGTGLLSLVGIAIRDKT